MKDLVIAILGAVLNNYFSSNQYWEPWKHKLIVSGTCAVTTSVAVDASCLEAVGGFGEEKNQLLSEGQKGLKVHLNKPVLLECNFNQT